MDDLMQQGGIWQTNNPTTVRLFHGFIALTIDRNPGIVRQRQWGRVVWSD
jgi:hypothetical protein